MHKPASATVIPPAMITHSVASIRGPQCADVSVYHARSCDARISMTFSGILMVLYSCHAAQGLLAHDPGAARNPRAPAEPLLPVQELTHPAHGLQLRHIGLQKNPIHRSADERHMIPQ